MQEKYLAPSTQHTDRHTVGPKELLATSTLFVNCLSDPSHCSLQWSLCFSYCLNERYIFIIELSEDNTICLSFVANNFSQFVVCLQFTYGSFALWFQPVSSCLEKPCLSQDQGKSLLFSSYISMTLYQNYMFNPTIYFTIKCDVELQLNFPTQLFLCPGAIY